MSVVGLACARPTLQERGEEGAQRAFGAGLVGLALPDGQHAPAGGFEGLAVLPVAADVAVELAVPEGDVGGGPGGPGAAGVLVPEAAVDEQDRPPARQHDVGPA